MPEPKPANSIRSSAALLPLVSAILATLLGCTTSRLAPLEPAAIEGGLAPDEAFVVIQIDTNVTIDHVLFSGMVIETKIDPGSHFWIGRVKAGRQSWRAVSVASPSAFKGRYRVRYHRYPRPHELDFRVKSGHVNYMGFLQVERGENPYRPTLFVRVQNRAAEALRRLEREHGALLDRYPLATASTSGDRFLEFYSSERKRIRGADRAKAEMGAP